MRVFEQFTKAGEWSYGEPFRLIIFEHGEKLTRIFLTRTEAFDHLCRVFYKRLSWHLFGKFLVKNATWLRRECELKVVFVDYCHLHQL